MPALAGMAHQVHRAPVLLGMRGMSAGGSHCCECAVPRAVTKSLLAKACGFMAMIERLMGMPSGVPVQFSLEHWQRGNALMSTGSYRKDQRKGQASYADVSKTDRPCKHLLSDAT